MRVFTDPSELRRLVRDGLGPGCRVTGVERLRGGSKKGVYRLALTGAGAPPTVIAYSWAPQENYWPSVPTPHASGLAPFLSAHHTLQAAGVRTPHVLYVSEPDDLALVEDIPGDTLEAAFTTDPVRAAKALGELAVALDHMAAHTSPADHISEDVALTRALDDLAESAARDPRIDAATPALANRLHELHAALAPRPTYSLVHGELGPDHILLTPDAHPVLIDIEALSHSDPEQEHAYLRLRFGPHYAPLSRPLDPARLSLHTLALHLSLVAGPLRLLDGDFPHRDAMRGIAEHNTREALRLVGPVT
ncbi:aminoglycoside phosphotransferase family protein [Streptomyces griseoluteus]|uniref:Aminoglycoside phosphotransferase family protein n=1 Tax=Streptomyces griseoluteus TaxID=29306 RepID=A0A4Z1DIB7_STRGP|nr:phosphotransferase [Streptomyces griseoluteus]TGN83096.1 aminoglycoside phosphotransferase family protein [Streptomyces griseoluteus]GHF17901.1 aminoglycoside phosphotransferase [Streptomyces griseoluteus]